MSRLRPECTTTHRGDPLPDAAALYLITQAVAKHEELIHGRLDDGQGNHCAMGWFWEHNPNTVVHTQIVDEVAAVNDSLGPLASPKERRKTVLTYLRWRLRTLAGGAVKGSKADG